MSLAETVARSGLAGYAEVALVIFFSLFVGIVLYSLARRHKARYEHLRQLPLEDGRVQLQEQPPTAGGKP